MKPKSDRTILDAVVEVLASDRVPRSSAEIHQLIIAKQLFDFRAKDPIGMVRAAIRKHLRKCEEQSQPPARVRQVEKDKYLAL